MLEKPNIPEEKIIACAQAEFGLSVASIEFLPVGADLNSASYRAVADDGTAYFLKLRSGVFDETSVMLPKFLSDHGIKQIIPPLETKSKQLRGTLDDYKVILYPFIEGRDGFNIQMTERLWHEYGATMKKIHSLELPETLKSRLRRETFSPEWREIVKAYMKRIETETFVDPSAAEMAEVMRSKRAEVFDLITRIERLAQSLTENTPEFVLCHGDAHAGNIYIDNHGNFHIIDWDGPLLAPKERDLMFPGGGQGFQGHTLAEEETLFYRGYGPADVDLRALAYFRYERIIDDMAIFCEQIPFMQGSAEDRLEALGYLKSNFEPGHTIEIAYKADKTR